MRFNTGNPVEPDGSSDPSDLYDNAGIIDQLVTGTERHYRDRKGSLTRSFNGMNLDFDESQEMREAVFEQAQAEKDEKFQQFLISSGYEDIGDYVAGLAITGRNQVFLRSGQYYRAKGTLAIPYTTTGNWAIESNNFVSAGDAVLRQDLSIISLRAYTGAPTGVSSNQSGIEEAVLAAAASKSSLFIPFGDYVSEFNIPGLHDIEIFGPGRIKVGDTLFYAQASGGQTNRIYVSASGNDANDGLSSARPIRTIQRALNVFKRYAGRSASQFYIEVDASTLTEGGVLDGVQSMTELVIEGKLSGGVPVTVINGATATTLHGLNFNFCNRVRTKCLDVRNFRLATGSSGIVFQNGTEGVIDTCVAANNRFGDFNCAEGGEMVLVGRCTMGSGSVYGVRYYRLARGSIGDGVNPITITGTLEAGILMRDGSKAVCNDNITLNSCVSGVRLIKHAYLEMRTATISNNTEDGIYADTFSIFDNAAGTITFSGNARDKRFIYFSQDRSGIVAGTLVPHWVRGNAGLSGQPPSNNYDLVVDSSGATGLQFLAGAASTINIDFNKLGRLAYVQADNSLRFSVSNADAYRMTAAAYIPVTDNTKALGGSTFRWSQVYAGTGTINTSDAALKQQQKPIDEACLRAWAKVSYSQYKFNDAVELKGDGARWHFGVIAQEVKEAFESEGLNACEYGVLCYDEWEESPGSLAVYEGDDLVAPAVEYRSAGSRYGIRYDEALILECAYLRSRLKG